jgi:hypothetical protein
MSSRTERVAILANRKGGRDGKGKMKGEMSRKWAQWI